MPGIVFCKGSTSPLYRTIKQCTRQGLYFVRDQQAHYIELYNSVHSQGLYFVRDQQAHYIELYNSVHARDCIL